MPPALIASQRAPTRQSRSWAVATVLVACRSGRLDLEDAETRLDGIYRAHTLGEVYRSIDGLPHPPAPLVLAG